MQSCWKYIRPLFALVLVAQLTGCGLLGRMFPDRSEDYKKAKTAEPLEVPPDLTTTTLGDALAVPDAGATLSGYTTARGGEAGGGGGVLPSQEGLRLERDRDRMWLVAQGDPAAVWARAREFWLENGFLITREDPATGVLETDWVENRAAIPKDIIQKTITRVFDQVYSSAYRDRYRMRLERGEQPGTTEIYITHQGVQEEYEGDPNDVSTTKWVPRPPDPDLEAEMLKRMMVYLGVTPERAGTLLAEKQNAPVRAELVKRTGSQAALVVHEDYSRAWRSIGIALDRVGFAVEDRDRSAGVYYVRYNDPLKGHNKGILNKLAFWSSDRRKAEQYQIKLIADGPDTRTVVLDEAGKPDTSVTGVRILTLLHEQLR